MVPTGISGGWARNRIRPRSRVGPPPRLPSLAPPQTRGSAWSVRLSDHNVLYGTVPREEAGSPRARGVSGGGAAGVVLRPRRTCVRRSFLGVASFSHVVTHRRVGSCGASPPAGSLRLAPRPPSPREGELRPARPTAPSLQWRHAANPPPTGSWVSWGRLGLGERSRPLGGTCNPIYRSPLSRFGQVPLCTRPHSLPSLLREEGDDAAGRYKYSYLRRTTYSPVGPSVQFGENLR